MVPAWAACPRKMSRSRSMPFVPVTVQMPRPRSSRIGPCSMCTSTYAFTSAMRVRAPSRLSMSTPWSARISGSFAPSLSVRPRSTSMSSVPMQAAEPNRLRLKRAPSSSAQSTTATVIGGVPSAASARSSSTPAITPSAPSSHPPLGTLSRCEPTTKVSGRSPRSTAHRLPASSSSISTGRVASDSRKNARACSQSGVHARRRLPSGPPVRCASSRRSATTRAGS